MKLFKNVKFMYHGWLDRNVAVICASIIAVSLVSLFYNDVAPLLLAGVCLGLTVLFTVISLFTLNSANQILATHTGHLYNKVNDDLSDLQTVPKMYDRYATFYSTALLGLIMNIVTFFANSDMVLIDSRIAYIILLFLGYSMFYFFTDNRQLQSLYKHVEQQSF